MIKYFLKYSKSSSWIITVIDSDIELALKTINNHENGKAFKVDIKNEAMRENLISEADIVISMLPPEMHYLIALDCIKFKKSLVTASYLSDKISNLNKKALENNILILNEMGLDPGIDHMSALQIINDAEKNGDLVKGSTVVEATAGNTGLGLALIALLKGYKAKVIILDKMNQNKIFLKQERLQHYHHFLKFHLLNQ